LAASAHPRLHLHHAASFDAELKASHDAPCIIALAHSHNARTDEVELKARLDAARYFLLPPPPPVPWRGGATRRERPPSRNASTGGDEAAAKLDLRRMAEEEAQPWQGSGAW
jgi:hypothetical protein